MKPLVSILMPAYNAENWIYDSIQSVLAQSWKNLELIVVNDGSIDATLSIAQSFESSKIKVLSQPNRGAAAARNVALQLAQGDFIQYLDADDLLAPDKLKQQILRLEPDDRCITSAAWGRFTADPEQAIFRADSLWQTLSPTEWLIQALEQNLMMNPACWLTPRSIAQAAGTWNETLTLNDDGEYFWRVVLASQGVTFCPDAKVYYRSSIPGSLSTQTSNQAWRSVYDSLSSVEQRLLQTETSDRTRRALATAFQRFIYQAYPAVPHLRAAASEKVNRLGGSDVGAEGGPMFQKFSRVLGWKLATRIQKLSRTVG